MKKFSAAVIFENAFIGENDCCFVNYFPHGETKIKQKKLYLSANTILFTET